MWATGGAYTVGCGPAGVGLEQAAIAIAIAVAEIRRATAAGRRIIGGASGRYRVVRVADGREGQGGQRADGRDDRYDGVLALSRDPGGVQRPRPGQRGDHDGEGGSVFGALGRRGR